MTIQKLNGKDFAQMVLMGANHLSNQSQMIDSLNVFPVPDGDTGTNMNLTMTSGAKEVEKVTEDHVGEVAASFAKGLLMGARGNSGVILSQLFRGFSKSVEGKESLTVNDLGEALEAGVETAYKAVMKPVEGTILTVAKDAAKQGTTTAKNTEDVIEFVEEVLKEAKASLNRTPDLLPVLKEVGVVDSGGQGLVTVYEGFLASLKGEELPQTSTAAPSIDEMVSAEHHKMHQDFMNTEDIEFGYCTEFMVKFEEDKLKDHPFDEEEYRNTLSEQGDSLLVVSDDDVVKVHIHTEYPGEAMTIGQKYGSLINIKIENMREQHTSIVGEKPKKEEKPAKKIPLGIVTVAMGDGIKEMFESLGATVVIEGGQTMNPSTQDIVEAVQQANAENVLILPNNKNIVMAAEQACELVEFPAKVVPTKTVPQGMSAMLMFNPEGELEANQAEMTEATNHVKTGQVTYAVRDTSIDGKTIEEGNFMGIQDGDIEAVNPDKMETVKELLKNMIDEEENEILTILQGEEATEEEVQAIESFIEEEYDEIEVEIHKGNQPIYSFIFSVE
ncbi:DAK2 domain-containing protein [Allobacillus halotolerans]|uniref:DAK2 domain-containing protein n=1 Tax=Allobacillus halotolerans TaxID=570278 RepID=A0ABS6GQF5_9BACI|nr:DAK2 domain-containing protein [Allobacillus halotolerans]MBU6081342.1 DAK2 domain-containing protein [Allobacillus halotolerans]